MGFVQIELGVIILLLFLIAFLIITHDDGV
jgi:hypothetical protein